MFLSEIIRNFDSQLSQEQTWAICYVTSKHLATKKRENLVKRRTVRFHIEAEAVQLTKTGSVEITMKEETQRKQSESEILYDIGYLLMRCLDQKLTDVSTLRRTHYESDLIELISGLVNRNFAEHDEGYEGDFTYDVSPRQEGTGIRQFRSLDEICRYCDERLDRKNITTGCKHYQNVVKALYCEAYELKAFLDHVTTSLSLASENTEENHLNQSVTNTAQECAYQWARFWLQVMHELRRGVHLKKVSQTKLSPEEYELLPRQLVYDSEISAAVSVRPTERSGLPENAREIILDFLASKPQEQPRLKLLHYKEETNDAEDGDELMEIAGFDGDAAGHVNKRKPLKVESPLWEKVINWDASRESLLSDDKNENNNQHIAVLDDLDAIEATSGFSPRHKQYTPRVSSEMSYDVDSLPTVESSFESNAGNISKKRLAVSTLCLSEINLREDPRVVGTSLYEISKTRKAIAKAEAETLPLNDPKGRSVRAGEVCFGCRAARFTIFSKRYACGVCGQNFCSKCIAKSIEIPNHLVDTKPRGRDADGQFLTSTKNLSKSMTDLVTEMGCESITPFPCKRHTLLQISSRHTYGGKVMNLCRECKSFVGSIIAETRTSRWHVAMAADI